MEVRGNSPEPYPTMPSSACVCLWGIGTSGLLGAFSFLGLRGPKTLQAPIVPPDDVVGMKDEVDNAEAPETMSPPPPFWPPASSWLCGW